MAGSIEDYALIGDCETAALVGRDGSIDWLCAPRFDSAACFAALLGESRHGRWQLAPAGAPRTVTRRYRDGTLILDTDIETEDGAVRVVDLMPPRDRSTDVVRVVEGRRGRVAMRMELIVRFDYGRVVPWVRRGDDGALRAVAGPDALCLRTPVELRGQGLTTVADFTVEPGQRVPFVLTWYPAHEEPPPPLDADDSVTRTERWWRAWSGRSTYRGPWPEAVSRSLITLKALTYAPTGGVVAAPTTSLPAQPGGVRNWDYRYCWLRDATFTLYALMMNGHLDEARAWRSWLVRAVAGDPAQVQIMYGLAGERRLPELQLPWLPGYQDASPVRIGNAAHDQLQLDVFGEVMDALHVARREGLGLDENAWRVQQGLLSHLETIWTEPDEGIWEVRGPRRHFTHSKVMAWVAVDRMVKAVERFGLAGPVDRWRALREAIHQDVCRRGFDAHRNTFVQAYGESELDASLLMIPLVGFLPASDPRVRGTAEAIERELVVDGFVRRYRTRTRVDGLPPGEAAFLPCSFWLADNWVLLGRYQEARQLFERLLGLAGDLGLMSEDYDPGTRRLLGNYPQAFTHVSLINTAINLGREPGPAERRPQA